MNIARPRLPTRLSTPLLPRLPTRLLPRLLAATLATAALGYTAPAAHAQTASGDGAWRADIIGNGRTLVIEDTATGAVAHRRALVSRAHLPSRAAALLALPARQSFLLALADAPELWEIALDPGAGPFHEGLVHSWERGMEESLAAEEGRFARRRIMLSAPLAALASVPGKRHRVIGTRADGTRVEISLASGREVADLPPG